MNEVIDYSLNIESLSLRELHSLSDLSRAHEKRLLQEYQDAAAHTDKINKLIQQKLTEKYGLGERK